MSEKAIHNRYKRYVEDMVERLRTDMFLHEWHYQIYFDVDQAELGEENIVASIKVDHRYLNFSLFLSTTLKDWFKSKLSHRVFDILAHELAHVYTEELYMVAFDACSNSNVKFLDDIRERQTQRIANLVLQQYKPKDYEIA